MAHRTGCGAAVLVGEAARDRCCGTSVYEVGLGAGAWPSALTDGGTNWTWTGAAETGEQILLAGHDGLRSVVYGVTVSATSGSLPTLTAPAVVAEFPSR